MKILLAVDGSKFTKKALAFLVTHDNIVGTEDEIVVFNVQPPVPPRVKALLGAGVVASYHKEEAEKVLKPIDNFLKRHSLAYRTEWVVGPPSQEVVLAAKREKAQMIVMGTHGHGLLGRALMGSVAQKVVAETDVPVLLVK